MTRDEAIKVFEKHLPNVVYASAVIDFYAEVGMLKLDEPKSARELAKQTIEREIIEWNMVRSGSVKPQDVSISMMMAFERAGLKIVEK